MCLVYWADPSWQGKALVGATFGMLVVSIAIIVFSYYKIFAELRKVRKGIVSPNTEISTRIASELGGDAEFSSQVGSGNRSGGSKRIDMSNSLLDQHKILERCVAIRSSIMVSGTSHVLAFTLS